MGKISNELREWCDKVDPKCEGFWNLRELADRIRMSDDTCKNWEREEDDER